MDNTYDVIVIGAGNAGLVAALDLIKNNKKVLVLESNTVPGGFATSFIRGRFEFEVSLQQLLEYGNDENPGNVYKLFKELGIFDKIDFVKVPDAYHVYTIDRKENYKMPFGISAFIDKMEEYVPKSRESMEAFFALAREVREALIYIEQRKGYVDKTVLTNDYANFMKVSTHSVKTVLNSLKMPKKAQEILTSYWIRFGSPASTLSFVHFSTMLYSYIYYGGYIPVKRSHEISVILAEEIEKLGGEIKYLSTVETILTEQGKISGVKLTTGDIYYAEHIVANCSPTFVYGNMLPKEIVPANALKLTNSRVLGARGFSIFLGLNQSAKDLGLEDYNYTLFHSLDSDKEFKNMSKINHGSSVVTVYNNANPSYSPKGTTIMHFSSMFFGDVFSKQVTEENYFVLKEKITEIIIDTFEETTKISIRPYIEEIEIASPVTFARYGGHPDGVIYGYKATGLDNLLPRIMNTRHEQYIPNLRFCGGFGTRLSGYSSTYLSGKNASTLTLKDIRKEEA